MPKVSLSGPVEEPTRTLRNCRELASFIAEQLQARGIKVEAQKSVTTSSIYLKFDNGLLRGCRVGDHKGRGYKYRYEIGQHYVKDSEVLYEWQGKSCKRYLFKPSSALKLVDKILTQHKELKEMYGESWYKAEVERRRRDNGPRTIKVRRRRW